MVRAVNTGIIDVGSRLVRFLKSLANVGTGSSGRSRVRIKVEFIGGGAGGRESETEGSGQRKRAYVIRVLFCITLDLATGIYNAGRSERLVMRNRA